MTVIRGDYTFTWNSGKLHPYGSAGDCVSGSTPDGDFKVNLNGTGFYLDSVVSL